MRTNVDERTLRKRGEGRGEGRGERREERMSLRRHKHKTHLILELTLTSRRKPKNIINLQ
jgi:hypothetical protein